MCHSQQQGSVENHFSFSAFVEVEAEVDGYECILYAQFPFVP